MQKQNSRCHLEAKNSRQLTLILHKVIGKFVKIAGVLEKVHQLVEMVIRDDHIFRISRHVDDLCTINYLFNSIKSLYADFYLACVQQFRMKKVEGQVALHHPR